MVLMTRQLGQNPGANHETLIGIRGTPGQASGEVRLGEIKGVIGTNEVPSDNITLKQDQWGKGPAVPPNQWHCVEVQFVGDQPDHQLWNAEHHVRREISAFERAPQCSPRVARAPNEPPSLRRRGVRDQH